MHIQDPGRIKIFFKDPNKKNFFKICQEVLVLWVTKKQVPIYYFKHLYRKDIKNYNDFLGSKLIDKVQNSKRLHKQEYISLLNNKLNFSLYCERHNLPTPMLVGHNFGSSFFYKNGIRKLSNLAELVHFYEEIFDSNNMNALFFRPLSLLGGEGCFKLNRETLSEQLEQEYQNLIGGDYTHTGVIVQHPDINAIYAKSINTLRIMTHTENGKVGIISSFMRFGTGGSVVDNSTSGGFSVGIAHETGTLKGLSYTDMKFGGGELERHPDTDVKFHKFQIPFYQEACELAIHASKYIPNGVIGWDIAITPTGPTIIEGNENPSFFIPDVLDGGLLTNQEMQKVIARL